MSLLDVERVNFGYAANRQVLHDVSFSLQRGRSLGLAAGNGKIPCCAGPGKAGRDAWRFEWMNRC